jgi:hypothetical protein
MEAKPYKSCRRPPLIALSDLDRLFCHHRVMVLECVTPMHHLMIMVSSVASGVRE